MSRRSSRRCAAILLPLVAILCLFSTTTATAQGATIQVNSACSLPSAIIAANTNTATGGCPAGDADERDTIVLQPGVTYTLSSELTIDPAGASSTLSWIRIEGRGATISGNNATRIFNVPPRGALELFNLTLTNGRASDGGAIKVQGTGILALYAVTIKDSSATGGHGGGIRSVGGILSIENSQIRNNTASGNGGGLSLEAGVNALITNTVIRDNAPSGTISGGGGIYINGSNTEVELDRVSILRQHAAVGQRRRHPHRHRGQGDDRKQHHCPQPRQPGRRPLDGQRRCNADPCHHHPESRHQRHRQRRLSE